MKSPSLTVCVVAAVTFLRMAQAKPDARRKAPPPAVDAMRGNEPWRFVTTTA
jgi:hypothetical protein